MKTLDEEQIEAVNAAILKHRHIGESEMQARIIAELTNPEWTPKVGQFAVTKNGSRHPVLITDGNIEAIIRNPWRHPTASEIGLEPFDCIEDTGPTVGDEFERLGYNKAIRYVNKSLFGDEVK